MNKLLLTIKILLLANFLSTSELGIFNNSMAGPIPFGKKVKTLKVEEEQNLNKCDPLLISQILPNFTLKDFIKPDYEVLRVCPSIQESCCTGSELTGLANILKEKGQSLEKMVTDMAKLTQLIQKMTATDIKKLQKLSDQNNCSPTEESTLEEAQKYIFLYSEKILRDTRVSVDFIRSRTMSLVCEICSTHSVFFLDVKPHETHLIVHNDFCKTFFTQVEGILAFRFFHHLSYYEPFVTSISCLFEHPMKLEPIFGKQNWKLQITNYEKCMGKYKKHKTVDFDECVLQCRTLNPLNSNIFKHISPTISSVATLMEYMFSTSDYNNCSVDSKNKNSNHIDFKCLFASKITEPIAEEFKEIQIFSSYLKENILDEEKSIFKVEWLISSMDGLNPDRNKIGLFKSVGKLHVLWVLTLSVIFGLNC